MYTKGIHSFGVSRGDQIGAKAFGEKRTCYFYICRIWEEGATRLANRS